MLRTRMKNGEIWHKLVSLSPFVCSGANGALALTHCKAVRLGDSRLLAALSRLLPANRWRDVLLQKNQEGGQATSANLLAS